MPLADIKFLVADEHMQPPGSSQSQKDAQPASCHTGHNKCQGGRAANKDQPSEKRKDFESCDPNESDEDYWQAACFHILGTEAGASAAGLPAVPTQSCDLPIVSFHEYIQAKRIIL